MENENPVFTPRFQVTKTNDSVENDTDKPKEPSTNGLQIPDSKYEEIIKKSLVTKGNNYLVKQVLSKMRAGEEVIVSTIGGSVTEGAGPSDFHQGYAYQFKDLFIEKYATDKDRVKFIPAGIGGTPSPMGLVRYQKDVVVPGGRNPDLLIIEFAANDWLECSNTRAMEYLVRNALEHDTAVIILYAAATYTNQQGQISPVANFYNLPQVSISDGLFNSGVNQEKDSKIYYSDYVHPTRYGHTYMAKCIMNLIDEIDASQTDAKYEIPATYKNENAFKTFATVYSNTDDKNVSIKAGAFSKKDDAIQGYMHGGKCFPENWYKEGPSTGSGTAGTSSGTVGTSSETAGAPTEASGTAGEATVTSAPNNEPFTMTLNCKSLIMIYKNANNDSFGKADVFVDGKLQKTYAGHEDGGWNNCMIVMIIDEQKSAPHTVEIKMAQGDEDKAFTILAFGYAQ
ncbi:MAG: SGNH/GDSL hydrolase family protein [Treponema sp.]|nr:SGNH/GDSL hydrolase family protein [Treponema sp.]